MDQVENVIRSATAKSKDGRIDVTDFLNEAAGSMRYGVFTPMEVGHPSNLESVTTACSWNISLRPTSYGILQVGVLVAQVNAWHRSTLTLYSTRRCGLPCGSIEGIRVGLLMSCCYPVASTPAYRCSCGAQFSCVLCLQRLPPLRIQLRSGRYRRSGRRHRCIPHRSCEN